MIEPEISLDVKLDLFFPSHEVVIPAKFTYFIKKINSWSYKRIHVLNHYRGLFQIMQISQYALPTKVLHDDRGL